MCEGRFRSVKAFSAFRATFSLGKHVFVRKTRISSINAFLLVRFRSVKAFSNLGVFSFILSAVFFVGKAVIVFARQVFPQ